MIKYMKRWLVAGLTGIWVFGFGLVAQVGAKTVSVSNPGANQNIQPALNTAMNQASAGDTVELPAGSFVFDGSISVTKPLRLAGKGSKGSGMTRLYRREAVSDATLESWKSMISFTCNSRNPSNIVVSGIRFEGKKPSQKAGDGLSQARDRGLNLYRCLDFVIENNVFANFGDSGVMIQHYDTAARGVISDNEFFDNWKINNQEARGTTTGYGVLVGSEDNQWKANPEFGSNNFIFVEDNLFDNHRHAIAAGGDGLYVFRHNRLIHNYRGHLIDAHGGGAFGNGHSTRAYEVYNNTLDAQIEGDGTNRGLTQPLTTPCTQLAYSAMKFRGGEGLIHDNRIEGYRYGIRLDTETSGIYPIPYQIGYQDGDIYIWGNTFIPYKTPLGCTDLYLVDAPSLIRVDRDFHLSPKPGYQPYTYPHPLRQVAGVTNTPPVMPTQVVGRWREMLLRWLGTLGDLNNDGKVNSLDWTKN